MDSTILTIDLIEDLQRREIGFSLAHRAVRHHDASRAAAIPRLRRPGRV